MVKNNDKLSLYLIIIFFILAIIGFYLYQDFSDVDSQKTNETIFDFDLNQRQGKASINLSIILHPVRNSQSVNTSRSNDDILSLFKISQSIWDQASINFDIEIEEIMLTQDLITQVQSGNFRSLYSLLDPNDDKFYIFFTKSLLGSNGIALVPSIVLVADVTSVNDYRATAHEIGHLLGLSHTFDSRTRLLYQGVNGIILNQSEIEKARASALRFAK